jgi:hypothetical protein
MRNTFSLPMQQSLWIARSIGWALVVAIALGRISAAVAQSVTDTSTPEICRIDASIIKANEPSIERDIVTADTVSPKGMTMPSLWWTSDEFPAKLITNWIADRRTNQIYLLVNTQYWNTLDYLDRYRAIDRFGRVSQGYGYALKVCNSQKIQVGSYACTMTPPPSSARTSGYNSCQISIENFGQTGLGVNQ